MGHGASNVRQSDVKRVILGAEADGKKVTSVEIEDGRIKIKVKDGNEADDTTTATATATHGTKLI